MPRTFIHARPLQALKLGAVLGTLGVGTAVVAGVLPDTELIGFLLIAFSPIGLALVVGAETLLAGYRLARADDLGTRLRSWPFYTAIRVFELVTIISAPGAFYLLILVAGSEGAGPGAVRVLLYGVCLGLLAFGAVILRTVVEYYDYRRSRSTSGHLRGGSEVSE